MLRRSSRKEKQPSWAPTTPAGDAEPREIYVSPACCADHRMYCTPDRHRHLPRLHRRLLCYATIGDARVLPELAIRNAQRRVRPRPAQPALGESARRLALTVTENLRCGSGLQKPDSPSYAPSSNQTSESACRQLNFLLIFQPAGHVMFTLEKHSPNHRQVLPVVNHPCHGANVALVRIAPRPPGFAV